MAKKRTKKISTKSKVKNPKSKKSLYFGKEAHEAIIKYQKEEEKSARNKIYEEEIKNSFNKLAENLIFIHGFARDSTSFAILKNDCVTFLYETLEKFDPSKGSKAFSYFNVCAKHFLIIQTNKRNKRSNRSVSLDNFKELSSKDRSAIENFSYIESPESQLIFKEDRQRLFEILNTAESKIKNQNEKICIQSIITLFKMSDELELMNKRAIFVYLREISGLNPKQLSVAMSGVRKQFRDIIKNNDEYNGIFNVFFNTSKGRVK